MMASPTTDKDTDTGIDTPAALSSEQLRALFDILTHHETYAEAESFKDPAAITKYGYPFSPSPSTPNGKSASPVLQHLLTKVVLPVPGVRDLPPEFWNVKFRGIMIKMGEANLSESYDKGALGTRKTLATASSVIHESVTRGLLGGIPGGERRDLEEQYDTKTPEGLASAWEDCVHELVHGNLVDELFDQAVRTEKVDEHSPAVQAAIDYAIIHIASFAHHVFVLSAEGQYLLKLLENVHKLIPYSMIRQTLRASNAATMIDGMIKLLLAKVGVGAISNWMGLTKDADEGMNLLQRIISLVLSWDSSEFRKAADKIESSKDGPSKEQLAAIKQHIQSPIEKLNAVREQSIKEDISIVNAIFNETDPTLASSLTPSQHTQCLEYYSAQLSNRDREEIIKVLCRQNPDLFTGAIRDAVSSFDNIIRVIHNKVDLREHISAMESFLNDVIETSKPKKADNGKKGDSKVTTPPTVEDYTLLLRRNRHLLYRYLHQFAENCPDIREKFRKWANDTIKQFRQAHAAGESAKVQNGSANGSAVGEKEAKVAREATTGAGAMSEIFQSMFTELPEDTKQAVLQSLDAHRQYLSSLEDISTDRMRRILNKISDEASPESGSMSGPGVYLIRWQTLLDDTLITPETIKGPIRHGKDVKGFRTLGKTVAVGAKDSWDAGAITEQEESIIPEAPDVTVVWRAFESQFKAVVADLTPTAD